MKKRWICGILLIVFAMMLCTIALADGGIEITGQPADLAAPVGTKAAASVEAASDEEIQYQWYFRKAGGKTWSVSGMAGSKTATITVPVTETRAGQQYKCVLTTASGSRAESDIVTVVIREPSVITIDSQPGDITAVIGAKGTATVSASTETGAELSYQWYFKAAAGTSWSKSGMAGSKTATITVPVTKARLGQQYKCVITTADGGRIETEPVAVVESVPSVITIDSQPGDITAVIGAKGTATVSASTDTGAELSYQWYFKAVAGTSWSKSGMTGSKTAMITVPVTEARLGQQYKCVITTADGGRIETEPVAVMEPIPSVITVEEQSDGLYAAIGENATATVEASANSGAELSYRWYFMAKNSTTWKASGMTGSKTATITVPVTEARLGQQYKCVITTADGGRIETELMTVLEKPDLSIAITHSPNNYVVQVGQPILLDISVSGEEPDYPMTYQWYQDGKPVEGANEKELVYYSVQPENAGTYYCEVSGYGYTLESYSSTVSVIG